MSDYLKCLESCGADGVLVADMGVFALAREAAPNLPVHISTQASATNFAAVNAYARLGAARVVLARELSLAEIREIRANTDAELEIFVHGAMCVSYSGRCLLSNYLAARDGNRGDCAQPCRWKYNIYIKEETLDEYMPVYQDERGSYILNARDLCLIEHLPELINAGADSLKIEGRVKSLYYAAVTVNAYRRAIDDYFEDPAKYERNKPLYMRQLAMASHRGFTAGFLFGPPDQTQQSYDSGSYTRGYDFLAVVRCYDEKTGLATIEQRNKFAAGEEITIIRAAGEGFAQIISELYDETGEPVPDAPHPQQILKMRMKQPVAEMDIVTRCSCRGDQ